MAKRKPDDADRPNVHPDVHPDANPALRWAVPTPPSHGGREKLVTRPHNAAEAVYVETGDGRSVWVSPGEAAYVASSEAARAQAA